MRARPGGAQYLIFFSFQEAGSVFLLALRESETEIAPAVAGKGLLASTALDSAPNIGSLIWDDAASSACGVQEAACLLALPLGRVARNLGSRVGNDAASPISRRRHRRLPAHDCSNGAPGTRHRRRWC